MTILTWLILSVIAGLVIFSAFIVIMACMNASQIDRLNEPSMLSESRDTPDEFQKMLLDSRIQVHLYPDNTNEVI